MPDHPMASLLARAGDMPKDAQIPIAYAVIRAALTDAQAVGVIERLRPAPSAR